MLHSKIGSWSYPQTLDWLENLARDKHSSSLQIFVNYGCKKFTKLTPDTTEQDVKSGIKVMKHFSS
jgi:hypothetical protein